MNAILAQYRARILSSAVLMEPSIDASPGASAATSAITSPIRW